MYPLAAVGGAVLVLALGSYVVLGVRANRTANAEKLRVLSGVKSNHVVLIRETGSKSVRTPKRVAGVLREVTPRGATLDKGRSDLEFIPLSAIRGVEDDRGQRLGDW